MVPGLGQWQLYKDQRTRLLARCPRLIKSNWSSVIYTKSDKACISFRVHHKSPMAAWQVWRFCSSSVSLWKHAVTPFFHPSPEPVFTLQCVVLIGSPILDASTTVTAEASSIVNPLRGGQQNIILYKSYLYWDQCHQCMHSPDSI